MKIRVPGARPDVVARLRLVDRLDGPGARVVLVSAPAGWGKTVLVADWLHRRGRSAAWLSLDALDDDPGRFCVQLAAALRSLPGDALEGAIRRLEQGLRGGGGDLARELVPLLAEGDDEWVVVLDDAHHLEDPALLELLDGLVRGVASGPRLVILTRVDPAIPLGRLRLAGTLVEIRERDLRFSREEAALFFDLLLPDRLAPELVARLEDHTEGWAAGLQMAALTVRQAADPAAAVEAFSGRHELMVEYLVEEILAHRDPPLQRFLMETSVLPRFTAEGCAFVTGDPGASRHLRTVEAANLFLVSLDDEQRWYRYHHLFSELLTFRLRRVAPDREETLRERASRWLEARGDVQEALAQAASMENPGRLVELLDRHGYPILARSEFAGFARWLPRVGDPLSHRRPMFLVALAWYRMQTERAPDLRPVLEALEEALRDPAGGVPPERLAEARMHRDALRAFELRMADRLDEALAVGEEVLRRFPEGPVGVRGIVEFNLGAVHLRRADMGAARAWLERAYESCFGTGAAYLVLASLAHLGAVAAQTEGVEPARQRLESAVSFAEEEGLASVPAFAIVLYQLAQLHWLADEPERARAWLERALGLTRDERETDIRANVLIHRARVELAQGCLDEAEQALTEAVALAHAHNVKPFATSLDVERARLAAARTGSMPPLAGGGAGGGWTSVREAETVYRVQRAVAVGDAAEATRLGERLRRASEPRGRGPALCSALLGTAAGAEDAQERHEAVVAAAELAAARGYVRPLLSLGGAARALLEGAVAQPGLSDSARSFLRLRVLPRLPDSPALVADGLPAGEIDLTDRERETLAYLASGRTNAAIARLMYLSTNTVKTHLKRIYAKLGVSTRTEAVEHGRALGLLDRGSGPPDASRDDHPIG